MTTETRRTRASRRALIDSFNRGWDRATHLGLSPYQLMDMPGGDSDAEIERRLFGLAAWIERVQETPWPALWSECRLRDIDALSLSPEEDVEVRCAELRASLANGEAA